MSSAASLWFRPGLREVCRSKAWIIRFLRRLSGTMSFCTRTGAIACVSSLALPADIICGITILGQVSYVRAEHATESSWGFPRLSLDQAKRLGKRAAQAR